ncbi:amino acid ABC transporter permease [Sciscionella marina]|uniref:amino acid ABC transporter permease n=1 Tax=Sciscionella marina TaxID=508770 RepID=UPI00036908E4|nr:amino acid ABC transporter permease [Sciscionella marina]
MTTEQQDPIKAVPVRRPGRWIGGVVIALIAIGVIYSIVTNRNFEWPTVWRYLFDFRILTGLRNTLVLTVLSMVIGVVGGIILAIMRLSRSPLVSGAAAVYIWFFRGTPLITQLIFWNFFSLLYPRIGWGTFSVDTNTLIAPFVAALLGLGLNEAAYMAEIVRGGISSVDEGQREAASALGMRQGKTLRRIVLPQAMRVILPPTGNETIAMLKTTSLVVVIGYFELMTAAQQIYADNLKQIPLLIAAAIWYLLLTSILSIFQSRIEKRYSRGVSGIATQPGFAERMFSFRKAAR